MVSVLLNIFPQPYVVAQFRPIGAQFDVSTVLALRLCTSLVPFEQLLLTVDVVRVVPAILLIALPVVIP